MKKIQLSRGKFAIIDDSDFDSVSQYKWSYDPKGYAFTNWGKRPNRRIMYLHRFLMSPVKGQECDHINQDKLDNRRENLRTCSRIENSRNRKVFKNLTGFKGVARHIRDGLFSARVLHKGQIYSGGYHKTALEAAKKYNEIALKLHGEFASLNNV